MITTKLMLDSLHTWVIVHRTSLEDYVQHYPYSNYLAIDATNTLRGKITQIINHIITLIAPHHQHPFAHHSVSASPLLSHQQINSLCKIKTLLDDVKIIFLTVGTIKRINTALILDTLEKTIRLASIPAQGLGKERVDYPTRNRSFDQIGDKDRPKSTSMRRLEVELAERRVQRQRAASIKNQLYQQMHRDLAKKQAQTQNKRQRRNISDYRYIEPTQKYRNKNYPQQKTRPEKIEQNKEMQRTRASRNTHQKRLFKYLEDDLQQKKKKRQQQQEVNQFLFETPKRYKYQTLPSTEQRSKSLKKNQECFDQYLPEYNLDQQKLDELKKELDEKLKMSKIQYTEEDNDEEQGEANMWQRFDKDSTQNQNTVENNLEDSLQIMKQEQALNKTGQFNNLPIQIAQQLHEYSFSND